MVVRNDWHTERSEAMRRVMKTRREGALRQWALSGLALLLACSLAGAKEPTKPGSMIQPAPKKKLIKFGWDIPNTATLLKNIREMEKAPFDGIRIRAFAKVPGGRQTNRCFSKKRFEESWFADAYENLRKVKFEKFTDNFVDLQATPGDMDWFNDKDWETALHNVGLIVKAGTIARCKGVQFDPELYSGSSPLWHPNALRANPALYDKYARQARLRGKQFIETIGQQMPEAVILLFHSLSTLTGGIEDYGILDDPDPETKLAKKGLALLPAFVNGMLDGIMPGMKIIDGNELSYYYDEESDYYRGYHMIKQKALRLIAPENVHKYQTQVLAGNAIYLKERFRAALPAAEEAKQFENMLYHALRSSDEYVWVWGERWQWWPEGRAGLPHGINEAILNAKDRLAGVPPEKLRDLSQTPAEERKGKAHAVVPAVPDRVGAPTIDGALSDRAWKTALHIKELQTVWGGPPAAQTQAWVTFDRENLYVALQCNEPLMEKLKAPGEKHDDDDVWRGDSVDVFVSKGPAPWEFYHYIINPNNVHWDSFGDDKGAFDGKWRSAVKKTPDSWQVELALPWGEMGMSAPTSGTELRGNLCRNRKAGGLYKDHSSWSHVVWGFVSPGNFGYWAFKTQ